VDTRDSEIEQLQTAVEHRTTIGVALGLLMAHHRLATPDDAFALLRKTSSHWQRKAYEIAKDLAGRRLDPGDIRLSPTSRPPAARLVPPYSEQLERLEELEQLDDLEEEEHPATG